MRNAALELFNDRLNENEVKGIAKSISKWTHIKIIRESFSDYVSRNHSSEIQFLRGEKTMVEDEIKIIIQKEILSRGLY